MVKILKDWPTELSARPSISTCIACLPFLVAATLIYHSESTAGSEGQVTKNKPRNEGGNSKGLKSARTA